MGTDIHIRAEYNDGERWRALYLKHPDHDWWPRDYASFQFLAGLREQSPDIPQFEIRGFPDDMDVHYSQPGKAAISFHPNDDGEDSEYWFGDHSFSWLTLAEIEDRFDPDHPITMEGMLAPDQQERVTKGQEPTSWCGWTNSPAYKRMNWKSTLHNQCRLVAELIELLHAEAEEIGVSRDNIRILFGFDS